MYQASVTITTHTLTLKWFYFSLYKTTWLTCNSFQDVQSVDQRAAIFLFTIFLKSLVMQSWCRCSFHLAMSSAPRSSLTEPQTKANALALSASIIQPVPRLLSKPWMDFKLAWKDSKYSWKDQKMLVGHTEGNTIWKTWKTATMTELNVIIIRTLSGMILYFN